MVCGSIVQCTRYNLLTPVTIAFAATASEEETPSVAVANSKK